VTEPFIIYALPRSKTAWLARFLSYGDWRCHHETAITMRSVADIAALFSRPNTGSAETAGAPAWQIIRHHVPNIRTVVVRRPVEEVVASMLAISLTGGFVYDEAKLRSNMNRVARALDKAAAEPGALVVDYAALSEQDACAAIFEHCLPYRLPQHWWDRLRDRNVQADVSAALRYYHLNRAAVNGFKRTMMTELRSLARAGLVRGSAA
jgi:hypothetical protein